MNLEQIIWIYLPIAIALVEIVLSMRRSLKKRTVVQWILTTVILALNSIAIYILVRILDDAWPTYIPHLGILISTVLLIVQTLNAKKKST